MIPIWSKLLISFTKAGTQKVPYLYLILLQKAQTVGHTRTPIRILTEKEKGKGKELGRQRKRMYTVSASPGPGEQLEQLGECRLAHSLWKSGNIALTLSNYAPGRTQNRNALVHSPKGMFTNAQSSSVPNKLQTSHMLINSGIDKCSGAHSNGEFCPATRPSQLPANSR